MTVPKKLAPFIAVCWVVVFGSVVIVVCWAVVIICVVVGVEVVGPAGGEHKDDTFNSSKHIITDGM